MQIYWVLSYHAYPTRRRKSEWYFPSYAFDPHNTISANVNCVVCASSGIAFTLVTDFFVCKVARETNEELRAIKADPAEGFDIGAILSIAKRFSIKSLGNEII